MLHNKFIFCGFDLDVLLVENKIWLHVPTVCEILKISNPSIVIARHIDKKYCQQIAVGVGNPAWFVTEPGFYQLVFRSKSPTAISLQTFVFETVIPSIREKGVYVDESRFSQSEREKLEAVIAQRDLRIEYLEADAGVARTQLDFEIENNRIFADETEIHLNARTALEKLIVELRATIRKRDAKISELETTILKSKTPRTARKPISISENSQQYKELLGNYTKLKAQMTTTSKKLESAEKKLSYMGELVRDSAQNKLKTALVKLLKI